VTILAVFLALCREAAALLTGDSAAGPTLAPTIVAARLMAGHRAGCEMPLTGLLPQGSAAHEQRPGSAGFALAPALLKRLPGWVFEINVLKEEGPMRTIIRTTGVAVASLLFALLVYGILALPGLISDRDSIASPTAAGRALSDWPMAD
jgi:hypothetical protein